MNPESEGTVLVVNDAPDQLELMSVLLGGVGYRVLTAADGREGFEVAKRERPHLIISDVRMPHADGIELCLMVRADADLHPAPVLLVSATRKDSASAVAGLRAGADDYLEAPYEPARLIAKVARLMERARAEEALRRAEEKYRGIFENAVEGIYQSTPEGRFISVNPAMARMYGYASPEEMIAEQTDIGRQHYVDPARRAEFERLLKKHGLLRGFESEAYRKDGNRFWISESVSAVRDEDGAALYYDGVVEDVTGRKRAEEALQESERRYRELVENAKDLIYTHDLEGRFTSLNKAGEDVTGYTFGQGLVNIMDLIAPEYREIARRQMMEKVASREQGSYEIEEIEIIAKGGRRVSLEVSSRLIYKDGVAVGVQGIARDITERKRAAGALRESQERYRTLFNSIDAGFCVIEMLFDARGKPVDYRFLETNPAFEKQTGLKDVAGRRICELSPQLEEHWVEIYGQVALTGEPVRFENRAEALDRWFDVYAFRFGQPESRRVAVLFNDITDRKRLEEERERFFELGADLLVIAGFDGHFKWVSPAWERIFGWTGGEVAAHPWLYFVHPEDQANTVAVAEKLFAGQETVTFENRYRRKDGEYRWLSWKARPYLQEQALYCAATDITERKRAEEEAREADQRAIREYEHLLSRVASLALALGTARDLTTIFRALRDFALVSTPMNGLFVSLYDPAQNVRTAAYAWSDGEEVDVSTLPPMEMTGSPQSRAVSTGQVIITDDYQSAVAGLPRVDVGDLDQGRLPRSSLAVSMSVMGRIVGAVEVQSTEPAAFQQGHATAMQMAANLTANAVENVRLLESESAKAEQLRQSQKLESVGQLAGGIAHDFNNLLTVISGYSDLLLRGFDDDRQRRIVEEVKKAAERAASLTRQLLAFSRKQVLEPKVLDLNDVVADADKMLRRLIGEDIELVTRRDPGLWRVKADPGQLTQVIVNLAVNARDAMPSGGNLTIETKNVELDEAYARSHGAVRPGPYVMLAVSDTGHGMDEEAQRHIFEPFFTTKEVGKGTGLGLSMVYGVVKQSGGNIWVYSEPGHGTTFKIYLPRVELYAEAEQAPALPELPKGTETVLLVEDEEMVRDLVRGILESEGYQVRVAADGNEALRICERHQGPIHLLVTDVVMPGMSGRQLVERLKGTCQDVKVLYMSGYTDNAVVHHGVLDPGVNFLQKPFTPDAMLRKVREILDDEEGR